MKPVPYLKCSTFIQSLAWGCLEIEERSYAGPIQLERQTPEPVVSPQPFIYLSLFSGGPSPLCLTLCAMHLRVG